MKNSKFLWRRLSARSQALVFVHGCGLIIDLLNNNNRELIQEYGLSGKIASNFRGDKTTIIIILVDNYSAKTVFEKQELDF